MEPNNIFKREEVKQPEYESDKKKDRLVLKDSLSSEEKKEFRDQLISLMVPIICWKEFPRFRNPEWATSITKGRHIIEDLKIKASSLDKNYLDDIWDVCFKRAKELVKSEIGNKNVKYQKVDKLTPEDIFKYDYTLPITESNYSSKTLFGKNFPVFMTSVALIFTLSVALYNLDFIPSGKILAPLFFEISLGMLIVVCFNVAISNPSLQWLFLIIGLLVSALFVTILPQQFSNLLLLLMQLFE